MMITRKRPPLVAGLALISSQLRGLLAKRATYAFRRCLVIIFKDNDNTRAKIIAVDCDDKGDNDSGADAQIWKSPSQRGQSLPTDDNGFPLGRWILFSVMALIPLAMSVLTVISLNPVTKNHYNRYWLTFFVIFIKIQHKVQNFSLNSLALFLGSRQWKDSPLQSAHPCSVQRPNDLCRYANMNSNGINCSIKSFS